MAWTTPDSYTVGEILAAAKLNTNVRDNLNYLKGDGTSIVIGSVGQAWGLGTTASRQAHIRGTGQAISALTDAGNTGGTLYIQDNGASAGNGGALLFGASQGYWAAIKALLTNGASNSAGDLAISLRAAAADSALTEYVRITSAGRVGIGRTAPQGVLHTYDAISGMIKWEFDGVDGTVRTVVPDGAGDAGIGVMPIWAVQHSGGTTRSGAWSTGGTVLLAPGSTTDIYSSGGNILQLQVSAGGAVTVQRTAGTGTYKVALLLIWL